MTFPALSPDRVLAAVRERWDLSGPLPVPRGEWLACPVCRSGRPQPRYWLWHRKSSGTPLPFRCDVAFKCVECSAGWVHGVAVDEDTYRRRAVKERRRIEWREARRMLGA